MNRDQTRPEYHGDRHLADGVHGSRETDALPGPCLINLRKQPAIILHDPVDIRIAEDSHDEAAPEDRHRGTHGARMHGNAELSELSVEPQEVPVGPGRHATETSKDGQARRNVLKALVRASSNARAAP